MTEHDENSTDVDDAARRASSIVSGYVDSIVENAERHATQIRREAKSDSERARREAVDSANRVLQRIDALERPLGELVMTLREEVDRVTRELDPPVEADAVALTGTVEPEPSAPPAPQASNAAPASPEVEEAQREQNNDGPPVQQAPARLHVENARPPATPQANAVETPATDDEATNDETPATDDEETTNDETPATDVWSLTNDETSAFEDAMRVPQEAPRSPQYVEPQAQPAKKEKQREGRLFDRLKRTGGAKGTKGVFITKQGNCSVCQKPFMAGSEENLRMSGWLVAGDVGVCPECQSDGWQLPEGARRPFRRAGQ